MDLSVAILQAISTGTFLFVVFMELLPQELQLREKNALTKVRSPVNIGKINKRLS